MPLDLTTHLVDLLGQPLASSAVADALRELAVTDVPDPKPGRTSVDIRLRALGLDIVFKPTQELRDGASFGVPPGERVAAVLFFHGPGFEKYAGYPSPLPYGLSFDQSRTEVQSRLGPPSGSSARFKNDRWDFERVYLTLDFTDDERQIKLVTVGLPWKPRA
jgi:hypothetical protein